MIQIISYDKSDYKILEKNYMLSSLDEFNSFDDFEVNIIDLSKEYIWRNNSDNYSSISCIADLQALMKEMKSVKKSKIVIVVPKNENFKYYYLNSARNYEKSKKIKNILPNIKEIISKNLLNIQSIDMLYSQNTTIINDSKYKSDFNFTSPFTNSFKIVSQSISSNKVTTILYNNVFITSLNIFETEKHLQNFLSILLVDKKIEADSPEWFEKIKFYNDNELITQKNINNKKIGELNKKNEDIEKKLDSNSKIKSILYTTGEQLVEMVMIILDDMLNNDSKDFIDEKKEDFLIKKENVTFIGEIKGISSAVSNKNVSQLDVHVQTYIDKITEEKIEEEVKGLLIINHQRNKALSERNEVHQNQIDIAKRNGALIIESQTLLYLYEKYLLKEINTDEIIKLLKDKKGVLLKKDF